MGKYYAVKKGYETGVYNSWEECEKQVKGFSCADYKSFMSKEEAYEYLGEKSSRLSQPSQKIWDKKQGIQLTQQQKEAYEVMLKGENVFLTGEAGTGKSFVIKEFIKTMKNKHKNVILCAPTGIAALQIGGVTIHRCFHASLEPQIHKDIKKIPSTVKNADVIIIDEISMCRVDLFEYVMRVIKKAEQVTKKKKQVVVVGDFFQLPPVTIPSDRKVLEEYYQGYDRGFAFEAPLWKEMNFKVISLIEVLRQDKLEFINALNKIRIGEQSSIDYFNKNASSHQFNQGITLCGLNKKADKINTDELNKLKTEERVFQAIVKGDVKKSDKPTDDQLRLRIGARVIVLVNDYEGIQYQNGSLGEVIEFGKDEVVVRIDYNQAIVHLTYQEWSIENYTLVKEEYSGITYQKLEKEKVGSFKQIPLKLAYAITIHKSQGQTYDQVNLIPHCFDCGQLYVALSRVKSMDGLCLLSEIKESYLICDSKVKSFYNQFTHIKVSKKEIYNQLGKQMLSLDQAIIHKCPLEVQNLITNALNELQNNH